MIHEADEVAGLTAPGRCGSSLSARALVRAMPGAIAVTDGGFRIVEANRAFALAVGAGGGEVSGETLFDLRGDPFRAMRSNLEACLDFGQPFSADHVVSARADRPPCCFRLDVAPWCEPSGSIAGLVLTLFDITACNGALEQALLREERLSLAVQTAGIHVFEVDFKEGQLTKLGAEETFFTEPKTYEELAADIFCTIDPRDLPRVREAWRNHVKTGAPYRPEYRVIRSDGREVWSATTNKLVLDEEGRPARLIGAMQDVTARRLLEARLDRELERARTEARVDPLTGLANRRVFVEAVQQATRHASRSNAGVAVLYLDLDHFKDVNDTFGHPAGDELLKSVAARLSANTRAGDLAARFGGDEFAVIAADFEQATDLGVLATKLIGVLNEPYAIGGKDVRVGVSLGVAVYRPGDGDAEALLSQADIALYEAKAAGRNAYRFFTASMDDEVRARVALGAELRDAIASGELFLLYQPQVDLETRRVTAVEALVRWRHPERGVLSPGLFLLVAEQMGLGADLGHWVLWEACARLRSWLDAGAPALRMCVNLSTLQFKAPLALEADIQSALRDNGLAPSMLEIELSEDVLTQGSKTVGDVLQRLAGLGVGIAIDQFGAGACSVAYLRRFPTDRIKIAQSFVRHAETLGGEAAVVRATIGLARELGIGVIAEGVENPEQTRMLAEWGCSEAQGFYFSKPLTAEEFIQSRFTIPTHLEHA